MGWPGVQLICRTSRRRSSVSKPVRWGFTLAPAQTGTTLTESWEFLPGGIAMFEEKFGDQAHAEITDRTQQALDGIPKTLAAIKQIAESSTGTGQRARS